MTHNVLFLQTLPVPARFTEFLMTKTSDNNEQLQAGQAPRITNPSTDFWNNETAEKVKYYCAILFADT